MSWAINIIGHPEDVKQEVNRVSHMPDEVKRVIGSFCDLPRDPGADLSIHVESHGHVWQSQGNIDLKIRQVTVAPMTASRKATQPDPAAENKPI